MANKIFMRYIEKNLNIFLLSALLLLPTTLYAGLEQYTYPEIPCKSKAIKCTYTERTECLKYLDNSLYEVVGGSGDVHGGYYSFCPKKDISVSGQIKLSWNSFVHWLSDNSVRIGFGLFSIAIILSFILWLSKKRSKTHS